MPAVATLDAGAAYVNRNTVRQVIEASRHLSRLCDTAGDLQLCDTAGDLQLVSKNRHGWVSDQSGWSVSDSSVTLIVAHFTSATGAAVNAFQDLNH